MFKLRHYLNKHIWQIILSPVCKIIEAATDVVAPFLVGMIIDVGIANRDVRYVIIISCVVIALQFVGIFSGIFANKFSVNASKSIGRDIRNDMFAHINSLSHKELDLFDTTTLVNRSIQDVEEIENAVHQTLMTVSRPPIMLVGAITFAMFINVKLACIFVIAAPLIFVVAFIIMKKMLPLLEKTKVKLDKITSITRDNLGGIKVVRAFNRQEAETKRFSDGNDEYTTVNLKSVTIGSFLQPVSFLIINFGVIAILWFGGIQVNLGILTMGNIVSLVNYFTQIKSSLLTLVRIFGVYTRSGVAYKRIAEVFKVQNSIKEKSNAITLSKTAAPTVEFKNVSFGYKKDKMVVKNLTLKVEAGQTIGIIGGTGDGKTSIVNLIPRFYDVTEGEVLVAGHNVKDYTIESLRNFVSDVPQDTKLFEGSLESNLRWRKEEASDEELIKALRISQSYDFVKEKPNFLKTRVNRGGLNFSGGQRQRLSIARALVGDPKILILDDSSSALDFATDAALRKAIATSLKGITIFLVSQRVNTLKQADNIIVIEKGDIVDIGTHEQLIERCNTYKEIYNSQNKRGVK